MNRRHPCHDRPDLVAEAHSAITDALAGGPQAVDELPRRWLVRLTDPLRLAVSPCLTRAEVAHAIAETAGVELGPLVIRPATFADVARLSAEL